MSYCSAITHGTENAGKTRPEEMFAKRSTKYLACGTQGHGFDSREDGFAFHVFKLAVMIVIVHCNMPILMPVAYKIV